MNKELTPLETWYLVKEYLNEFHHRIVSEDIEVETIEGHPINIIENALKENEKLKKCFKNELKNVSYYNNLALKYKKALEIIKEKILDMDYFNIIADRCDLTYQEYNLLREVLQNESTN